MKFIDIIKEDEDKKLDIRILNGISLSPEDSRMVSKMRKVYRVLRKGVIHLKNSRSRTGEIIISYELPSVDSVSYTVKNPRDKDDTKSYWLGLGGNITANYEVLNPDDFDYNEYLKTPESIIRIYSSQIFGNIVDKFSRYGVKLV